MHRAPGACSEKEWLELLHGLYPEGEIKAMRRLWLDLGSVSEELATDVPGGMHPSWARLVQGEPIQYVLGKAYFMGKALSVGSGVLIPRPETEELVEWVLGDPLLKPLSDRELVSGVASFLDLGTGSGCIALALAKGNSMGIGDSMGKVIALDCEAEALQFAQENAQAWGVASRVELEQSDFMSSDWKAPCARYWVSNPPYIGAEEAQDLDKHVMDYEPSKALFAPGSHPMDVYRTLIGAFLESPCSECLWLELNPRYALEIGNPQIWGTPPNLEWTMRQDMQGKNRMLRIRKQG
ncbi:MAG: peptide chain release factor N(5)-glutamine methyltransferase [Sphingobacteriia bacterium]|nr:peptide chain release factor N(5)-glutamine methyltransferase [Sphingobacteriia bacterium]